MKIYEFKCSLLWHQNLKSKIENVITEMTKITVAKGDYIRG